MQIQIMFILVPDTVKRSLSHGAVPRTEIHFPNVLNSNPKADFDVTAVSYSSSRGGNFGRYELHRLPQYETRPCCVPCQTSTLTNEDHIFPQGVLDHSVFASHMSPSEQGFVELKTCNTVSDEGMGLGKVGDTREGDELENLESPRTFGSSTSSSTKGDTVNQDPVKHTIMHISRSQITNPWGSASYSDLITMAITSTPENMMTLSQIYGWIVKNVPYFNDKGSYLSVQGWKNAVRHTLSLRKRFIRVPDPERPYKSMWTISSDYKRSRSPKTKDKRRKDLTHRPDKPIDLDRTVFLKGTDSLKFF